ncbi:hypothetical protein CBR_g19546 [Chara braunii]|uniref:UBC core domain-containing protein n=1 Tax=Chara braunii TaxID=69332 RepID=A0A388KYL3_CHABU|nr:hypothetical protein CBR_g19546 [Chara braunii]|eukprot:GBG75033.1 hypothetical protein CBR_g19546 [Chara braunii]
MAEPESQQFNLKNPAVKRILQEMKEMRREQSEDFISEPLEDNIFEWHFAIRGPRDSEFEGGIYHGRIILPSEYPFKPPTFMLLTPNGRFETQTKICLSISDYHPEHWQPGWSVRTALVALRAFMETKPDGALGSLDYSKEERRGLAIKSRLCPPKFGTPERQKLIQQVHERMLKNAPPVPELQPSPDASGKVKVEQATELSNSEASDTQSSSDPPVANDVQVSEGRETELNTTAAREAPEGVLPGNAASSAGRPGRSGAADNRLENWSSRDRRVDDNAAVAAASAGNQHSSDSFPVEYAGPAIDLGPQGGGGNMLRASLTLSVGLTMNRPGGSGEGMRHRGPGTSGDDGDAGRAAAAQHPRNELRAQLQVSGAGLEDRGLTLLAVVLGIAIVVLLIRKLMRTYCAE